MRFERVPAAARAWVLAAALACLGAACSTGPGGVRPAAPTTTAAPAATVTTAAADPAASTLPDLSARPLQAADLLAMLPPGGRGVAAGPAEAAERGNTALLAAAILDPDDETDDVTGFGRLTGVTARYAAEGYEAHAWIDLLTGADSAHGYLIDTAGDITKRTGGSHRPDIDLAAAEAFPVEGIGDEALGLILTLHDPTGDQTETAILFRSGRLVGFASVVRSGQADDRVAVQYLAEEMAARMLSVMLAADPPQPEAAAPEAFGFTFEQEVTAGAEAWTLSAGGRVVAGNLTCRVRAAGPRVDLDRDLVVVAGRLWARDHGIGDYREVGGGNPAERALLAFCPAWPTGATTAGLAPLAVGEPAHHVVSGVAALGYQADAAGLAAAVGADLGAAVAGVFNFWIGADTGWVLEVNLSVSGTGADLAPLLGPLPVPDGAITVTARHRLDFAVTTDPILPPS